MSSLQVRAMFVIATLKLRGSSTRPGIGCRRPARSTNTERPPLFTMTSVTVGSSSSGFSWWMNGRMRSKLLMGVLDPLARHGRLLRACVQRRLMRDLAVEGGGELRPVVGVDLSVVPAARNGHVG